MSLHKFAEQVAAHGRGDDSLLVHMTPDEVRKLQQFAEANGTTLTINPHTGLPEAGLLSDFFKMVAPVALGAFLGPAGVAFGGPGLSAAMAGVATGGITALATGSLSRGLMAGLGAYGGAGLGAGLETAGLQAEVAAGLPTVPAEGLAQADIPNYVKNVEAARGAAIDKFGGMSMGDKFSAGLGAIKQAPMDFLSKNAMPLAAAAAPIMAGAMVPTTTKAPTSDTGNIRKFSYDPYGQSYTALGVYPAAGYKGMAGGGIVALANGGVPGYAGNDGSLVGGGFTQDQINSALQAELAARPGTSQADLANYAKSQYGLTDEQINAAYAAQQPAPMTQAAAPAPQAQALQTATTSTTAPAPVVPDASDWWASQPGGVNALYDYLNNQINTTYKNATDAQVDAAMQKYGISAEDIHNALQKGGGSLAEEYAIGAGNMGLSGLNQNINSWISMANADPTFRNLTPEQKRNRALDAMGTVNMNEADVVRATGKTLAQLFPNTAGVTPTGVYGTYGNATGNPLTATSGDIGMNPDGTVTVTPNIPGRPQGGFTGMGQVKDVYTAGGGSLGQTNLFVPKTEEELYARYGNTGGSQQAYDYLMGKGAVDIKKPVTPTGEIMKPYNEAVMGMPANLATKKYIFQNGKYVLNPDYKPLAYDSKGNRIVSASAAEIAKASQSGGSGFQAMVDAGTITYEQIASALGITVDDAKKKFPKANPIAEAASTGKYDLTNQDVQPPEDSNGPYTWDVTMKKWVQYGRYAGGGTAYAVGGGLGSLGSYSDGGRLLKGPGDGVSDSIPATIGAKQQPARLADGEFVVPARIVSELGNGSTEAGAKKLYAMMDRVQKARGKTTGKNKVAANTRADKYLPA